MIPFARLKHLGISEMSVQLPEELGTCTRLFWTLGNALLLLGVVLLLYVGGV